MSCLYPRNAASTGYVKGCRCPRCRYAHASIAARRRLRAVERKANGETASPTTARYPVPAELVMRHVNAWLDASSRTWEPHQKQTPVPLSPIQQLAERTGRPNIARVLWRLEREVDTTSFGTADMLISAIDPRLWHTDPDLHAILEGLPNPPVDDNETDELLTDEEIHQWAIDTRASMTPAGWKELRKALAWFSPELPEFEAA